MTKPSASRREMTKLKQILSVRERQLKIAIRSLKEITDFRPACLSVFEMEVNVLQYRALLGLVQIENLQRRKPLTIPQQPIRDIPVTALLRDAFNSHKNSWDEE